MRGGGLVIAIWVMACGAPANNAILLDAAPQLPAEPATCGGGAGVTAQGALYNAEYVAFAFDGATVTTDSAVVLATASGSLTFATDTAVGDHPSVPTQIKLGGELRTTNLGHIIIDQADAACVAGRFEVALRGRVAGSFHTQ